MPSLNLGLTNLLDEWTECQGTPGLQDHPVVREAFDFIQRHWRAGESVGAAHQRLGPEDQATLIRIYKALRELRS